MSTVSGCARHRHLKQLSLLSLSLQLTHIKHKNEIILNCVNESLVKVDEIRSSVSEHFQKEAEQLNIVSIRD